MFDERVFRLFSFFFSCVFQVCFPLVHSSGLSISLSRTRGFFFLVVCFSFSLKNFGFAVGGQHRSWRLDRHVAGLGQGAGRQLLRGSLCLKPLRISYCSFQGAGSGLAEGFLATASPRVQATGAPLSGEEGGV